MQLPPAPSMLLRISTIAASSVWIPTAFSRHVLVRTYKGGETSLTLTWLSGVFRASAVRSAVLTASIPSYPKQVTSTSARTFVGWGVRRFPIYDFSSSATTSLGKETSCQTSGFLDLYQYNVQLISGCTYVIESLNASTACPYFLFSGQPMRSYRSSMGCWVFSATCRIIEWTILLLLYLSSHLTISSGDTLRFERSIYPAIPLNQSFKSNLGPKAHPSPCLLSERLQPRCAQL